MLDSRKILGSFSVAIVAQGIVLITGMVTTLLIPKVLGITEFGYWQLFIFYCSYTGFFHLGLNDGVYLINGGIGRAEIDKKSINSQLLVGLVFQFGISIIIFVAAVLLAPGPDRLFVIALTCIYLLVANAASFIGFLLQAMDETKLYSAYSALNSAVFLVALVIMLVLGVDKYQFYISFYVLAKCIGLTFCLWQVRDFAGQGFLPKNEALQCSFASIIVGCKLMIANVASMLIIGVSRFLIDAEWGIEEFSIVSFAFSLVSFFLLFAGQASMVLFPALRKADRQESEMFFTAAQKALDIFLPACFVLYFPAVLILSWWLPQYQSSLVFFAYLLPIVVFDGKMHMLGNTYLLVMRKETTLLAINIAAVALSALGSLLGCYVFHSIVFMLFSSVFVLMLRSIFVERLLQREFQQKGTPLFWGLVAVMLIFVLCTLFLDFLPAAIIICVAYAAYLVICRKDAIEVARILKSAAS